MRYRPRADVLVLLLLLPAGRLAAQSGVADSSFRAFLPTWEKAVEGMIGGDTTAFLANASHADDVTLLTPHGPVVRGWAEVSRHYRFAAAQMVVNTKVNSTFDYLAVSAQGDWAYIVVIERSEISSVGDTIPQIGVTRVTEVFRRESGQWKMVHRHMDHLLDQPVKNNPGSKHC